MADGADTSSRLSKLARLKNLKSGLNASESTPKADATPPPVTAEKDSESLSAYFEALGIVPDGGQPAAPESKLAKSAPKAEGREVGASDIWQDPVRNDDAYITSFQGDAGAGGDTDEDLSLDSIIGDFAGEEEAPSAPETADVPPAADADAEPQLEALPDFDAEMAQAAEDTDPAAEPVAGAAPTEFDMPVDIEAFEAETAPASIDLPEPEITDADIPPLDASEEPVAAAPVKENGTAKPLTITFDEGRATLLHHVSKQMSCSIDDVVVTAIDWYLDALFGEDDPDLKAEADGSA